MNATRSVVRVRGRTFATWRELSPESKASVLKWATSVIGSLAGFGYLVYREEKRSIQKEKEADAKTAFAYENASLGYRLAALAEAKAEAMRNHHESSDGNQTRNSHALAKIADKYAELKK